MGFIQLASFSATLFYFHVPEMKKIFGKIDNRRDEKETEKAHSGFIGKKFVIGKHPVVVEVELILH